MFFAHGKFENELIVFVTNLTSQGVKIVSYDLLVFHGVLEFLAGWRVRDIIPVQEQFGQVFITFFFERCSFHFWYQFKLK